MHHLISNYNHFCCPFQIEFSYRIYDLLAAVVLFFNSTRETCNGRHIEPGDFETDSIDSELSCGDSHRPSMNHEGPSQNHEARFDIHLVQSWQYSNKIMLRIRYSNSDNLQSQFIPHRFELKSSS